MATNPPSNLSLNGYWDVSPDVLIKDLRGWLFSFPTGTYNNGSGGTSITTSDTYTYANGKWYGEKISTGSNINGSPWTDTRKVNEGNYSDKNGLTISNSKDDNANSYGNITTLNNHTTPLGYDKISSGSGDNKGRDTRNYVIAKCTGTDSNFHFSVYTKKNLDGFFNDLVSANKSAFLKLATKSCSNKTLRFEWGICNNVCTNNDTDYKRSRSNDDTNNCISGAREWCKADTNRIATRYSDVVDVETHEQCRGFLTAGDFDYQIGPWCEQTDWISSKLCADIRQNKGSSGMKTKLNKFLFTNYCNSNDRISNSECSDVANLFYL